MRINKEGSFYTRLLLTGFVVLFGLVTIIASAPPPKVWVKPGGNTQEFSQDKYACMQQSQQSTSDAYYGRYGGFASSGVETNWRLFDACMEARGWSLQQQ